MDLITHGAESTSPYPTIPSSVYTYAAGNRLVSEVKTTDSAAETTTYTYDANGNQLTKTTVDSTETRVYNGLNQLVSVSMGSAPVTFQYRPDGLRHSKSSGASVVTHLWDGQNIVAEIGTTGSVTARYLRGINLVAREQDCALQYYTFNAHGDVTQRYDANCNLLKNYNYDAFGIEIDPEPLDSNPFCYCGEYFDKETGEIYLRAKYYNPVTGRFGAEDSVKSTSYKLPNEQEITDPLSLNLYTYGSNNPVLYVNNSGNFAVLAVAAIALGIGIIAGIASGSAYARYGAMAQDANWYTVGNWATAGSFDMVKGAVAPEKLLSAQHWMDSLGTAMMFMPAIEAADKGVSSLLVEHLDHNISLVAEQYTDIAKKARINQRSPRFARQSADTRTGGFAI